MEYEPISPLASTHQTGKCDALLGASAVALGRALLKSV